MVLGAAPAAMGHTIQGGWNMLTLLLGISTTTTIDANCDYYQDMQTGQTYYVYSPNYPNAYPGATSCRWYAVSSPGTNIHLDCKVELPQSTDCRGDHVIVSLSGDMDMADGHRYCGVGTFADVTDGNKLNVELHTLYYSSGGKFICSIEAVAPPPPDCNCGWKQKTRIVGGSETGVNEYPMMAGLVDSTLRIVYCGSTIISTRYVVTASHCLLKRQPTEVAVLVGDHDTSTGSETDAADLIRAELFTMHPQYDADTQVNDIGLVKLSRDLVFSKEVGPACLPFRYKSEGFAGQSVTALGWGRTEFGGPLSDKLKQTMLDVLPQPNCTAAHATETITDQQMCTFQTDTDACQSDSGGPLLWQDPTTGRLQLVGIISYGIGCASDAPGVNTRVSSYVDWIRETTQYNYCIK